MNEHEFDCEGYKITTYIFDGDPERLKELWIHANGEYIGFIKFRKTVPSRETVEQFVGEYVSELVLGLEP